MFDIIWDLLLLIVPIIIGYLFNVFREYLKKKTIKELLRFENEKNETPDINCFTANPGIRDSDELVELGYVFEYMAIGEIKSKFYEVLPNGTNINVNMSNLEFEKITPTLLKNNLVVIGGPFHNSVTRDLFSRIDNLPFHFEEDASLVYTYEDGRTDKYTPNLYDPNKNKDGSSFFDNDYALILNIKNPYDIGKRIILIAGCRSVGCYGAAVYLTEHLDDIKNKIKSDEYALVITCNGEKENLVGKPKFCNYYPLEIKYKK